MPLKLTDDAAMKPVPFTVKVNCGELADLVAGERDVIAGAGLLAAPPSWLTVKVSQPAVIVNVLGAPVAFCPTL